VIFGRRAEALHMISIVSDYTRDEALTAKVLEN